MQRTVTVNGYEVNLKNSKDTKRFASAELVFLIIIEASGFILNCAVLLVIYLRYKFLQDKTRYILLGNILLCDFILLCFIIPTSMKFASCEIESCRAVVLESFCSSLTLLFEFSYICTICTQACLAVDTVLKVRYTNSPFWSRRRYWVVVVLSWVISFLPTVISRLPNMNRENFTFYVDLKRCEDYDHSGCFYQMYIFFVLHVLIAPIIPGCYFHLAFTAKRLSTRLKQKQNQISLLKPDRSIMVSPNTACGHKTNEGILNQLAETPFSSSGIKDSVLQDIRYLFARSLGKAPMTCIGQTNLSHISNPMPKSMVIHSAPLAFRSEGRLAFQIPHGITNSPQTPNESTSNDLIQKDPFNSNENVRHKTSYITIEGNSHIATLVHKSTQTSLVYKSTSISSEEWESSSLTFDSISNGIPHAQLSVTEEHTLPNYLQDKSRWSDKVNVVEKSSKHSTDPSIERYKQTKAQDPSKSAHCHFAKNKRSETETPVTRKTSRGVLKNAVSTLYQQGLLLMTVVYGCSVPYAVVSRCSKLDFPSPSATVAVCLYYSTCIWYPLIYFFMSANFRKQLRMTTNGGHS
ncbi:hypothetical protein ElyMa_001523200 [Elysia marginata]|uniref:G-protein coupled receptors family 1 profile domain-containing protein n=1 Tax=Elysia marginata TaxID=1093978 RepID=A0AAV4JAF8_9GAST|nr:hypothetical protein ElyMa_001523200 [Elysia marginata]